VSWSINGLGPSKPRSVATRGRYLPRGLFDHGCYRLGRDYAVVGLVLLLPNAANSRWAPEITGTWGQAQFLTKREDGREYFVKPQERVAFNSGCWIKAQLREIAMSNFAFGVPVKTRLPIRVWSLAAILTLFSLASSIIHFHDASDHAIYAGVASPHASPRGS
jgi:hypothetical protein